MGKWCGRGRRRGVMKTVGVWRWDGGGCWVFGVSKGISKASGNGSRQLPLHHPSGCSGFWKAAADRNWMPKEGLGWEHTCISKEETVLSGVHSRNARYRHQQPGLSLLLYHLCHSNDMNGWGTDDDGTHIVQRQGLFFFQDRTMTWNTQSALQKAGL